MSVVCAGYGYVGLAASVIYVKLVGLNELFVVGCLKAEHYLAHRHKFFHKNIFSLKNKYQSYVHNFFVLAEREKIRDFEKPGFSGGIF